MARTRILTPRSNLRVDIPATTRDAIDAYANTLGIGRTAATVLVLNKGLAAIRAEQEDNR